MCNVSMDLLSEVVNEYGSLFYGVILGIFLVAFYMKKINGNPVSYNSSIKNRIAMNIGATGAYFVSFDMFYNVGMA